MQFERIVALKGLGLSLHQIAFLTKDEAGAAELSKPAQPAGAQARQRMERAARARIRRRREHVGVETAPMGGPAKLACRHAELRRVPLRHGMVRPPGLRTSLNACAIEDYET